MARWVPAEKYSIVARRNGLRDLLRQDGCWLGNGTKEGGGLTFWVSGRDCHGGPINTVYKASVRRWLDWLFPGMMR